MILEQTSGSLKNLADDLFEYIQQLTGATPQAISSKQAYHVPSDRGVFLYLRLVGPRARKYPPNSVHLIAKWDEQLAGIDVHRLNNWFGSNPSADFMVRAEVPEDAAQGKKFIEAAYRLRTRR